MNLKPLVGVELLDSLPKEGLQKLEEAKGFRLFSGGSTGSDRLQVQALIIRSHQRITRTVIESYPNLKVIATLGVGTDHIDAEEVDRRRIKIVTSENANSSAVAELTFGLLLVCLRSLDRAFQILRSGHWERDSFMGSQLEGKTIGILGLGRIGTQVSHRARAFGMKIQAYDPYKTSSYCKKHGAQKKLTLKSLLQSSDIVSLHLPLNDETQQMINEKTLSHLDPQALLVNTSRGGIVNEHAIVKALERRELSAYLTDVFEREPLPGAHPFRLHPRVFLSPHLGARTTEAQAKVGLAIAAQIIQFFKSARRRKT